MKRCRCSPKAHDFNVFMICLHELEHLSMEPSSLLATRPPFLRTAITLLCDVSRARFPGGSLPMRWPGSRLPFRPLESSQVAPRHVSPGSKRPIAPVSTESSQRGMDRVGHGIRVCQCWTRDGNRYPFVCGTFITWEYLQYLQ